MLFHGSVNATVSLGARGLHALELTRGSRFVDAPTAPLLDDLSRLVRSIGESCIRSLVFCAIRFEDLFVVQLKIMGVGNPGILFYLACLMAYDSILYCHVTWELIQALVILYIFHAIRAVLPHIVLQNILHVLM